MKTRIIIASCLFLTMLVFLFIFFEVKTVSQHRQTVNLALKTELEKRVGCKDCMSAYVEDKRLYIEFEDYPKLNASTTKQREEELNEYADRLGLLIGLNYKDTDLDTCRFVFKHSVGIVSRKYSVSILIKEHANVADKMEVAAKYCRAISDSDYTTAIALLSPDVVKNVTQEKFYNSYDHFRSLGEIRKISLQRYFQDVDSNKNFLGIVTLVAFENNLYKEIKIGFPYDGPNHIIDFRVDAVKMSEESLP